MLKCLKEGARCRAGPKVLGLQAACLRFTPESLGHHRKHQHQRHPSLGSPSWPAHTHAVMPGRAPCSGS